MNTGHVQSVTHKDAKGRLWNVLGYGDGSLATNAEDLTACAPSVAAAFDAIDEVVAGNQTPTVGQAVSNVRQILPGTQPVEQPPQSWGAPQPTPAQQAYAAAAPVASAPTCRHGAMVFREGDSARGHWTAHFCPTPKGTPDQCKPIFG